MTGTNRTSDIRTVCFVCSESPKAKRAAAKLRKLYPCTDDPMQADAIVALGGDGFMLAVLRQYVGVEVPIYGMNRGTVGFLMNEYQESDLLGRINRAVPLNLHPLRMQATTIAGETVEQIAINEVSLFRETRQAAKIDIKIDGIPRLKELICDGVLLATPAGSTAYNLSAHGPIVPLGSHVLALTPISAFRPRRWRGALLPHNVKVEFSVRERRKRPVSAVADSMEVRDVTQVTVWQDTSVSAGLYFDPEHHLEERILTEQFHA